MPPDVIAIVTDADGHVLEATERAQELFDAHASHGAATVSFERLNDADSGHIGADMDIVYVFSDRAGVKRHAKLRRKALPAEKLSKRTLIIIELVDGVIDADKARRRLEARMQAAFDANEDILFFLSESGIVFDLNKAALRFVKKARQECLGDYLWNLFGPSGKTLSADAWRALLDDARADKMTPVQTVLRGDARERLYRISAIGLPKSCGDATDILCAGRDITDIVRMRLSFQEAQSRLEQTVAERTKALTEAKKLADEANLSKSRFLANMSHELRTPLNAILGYADLMLQDLEAGAIDPAQAAGDLGRVRVNAKHLLMLINDVLDLAKVEANKMELSYCGVVIKELLDEISASVDPLVAKNGNRLTIACETGLDSATIDRQKVMQCLLNLLSNAAKFTEAGDIFLTLSTKQEAGARILSFEVKDTGRGMTEAQCATVFQEFVQVTEGDKPNYGGTGLGLPIAKKFAQLMGGDITAQSRSGEGSVFTLSVRDGPVSNDNELDES
ncbi:MAG: ATP-binding protein [Amphiplicatus sp.]